MRGSAPAGPASGSEPKATGPPLGEAVEGFAGDEVFGADGNAVTLFTRDGADSWPRQSKTEVARKLAARIAEHFKA